MNPFISKDKELVIKLKKREMNVSTHVGGKNDMKYKKMRMTSECFSNLLCMII